MQQHKRSFPEGLCEGSKFLTLLIKMPDVDWALTKLGIFPKPHYPSVEGVVSVDCVLVDLVRICRLPQGGTHRTIIRGVASFYRARSMGSTLLMPASSGINVLLADLTACLERAEKQTLICEVVIVKDRGVILITQNN